MRITLRGVSKQFGEFAAVDNVDLDIPSGVLLALLGPSGCGKTSLLRIIAGLETRPDERQGPHRWSATQRSGPFAIGKSASFSRHYALFRHMTVFDNIAFGLKVKPRRERPATAVNYATRCSGLLDLVQLGWAGERYPAQLSGGQKQRVALARALWPSIRRCLLLDEPFGALGQRRYGMNCAAGCGRLHDRTASSRAFS